MVLPAYLAKIMSLRENMACSGEEIPGYYESIAPGWSGVETVGSPLSLLSAPGPIRFWDCFNEDYQAKL